MTAPTVELITGHKWRPPHSCVRSLLAPPVPERVCEFMNCRRPRSEHAASVSLPRYRGRS